MVPVTEEQPVSAYCCRCGLRHLWTARHISACYSEVIFSCRLLVPACTLPARCHVLPATYCLRHGIYISGRNLLPLSTAHIIKPAIHLCQEELQAFLLRLLQFYWYIPLCLNIS